MTVFSLSEYNNILYRESFARMLLPSNGTMPFRFATLIDSVVVGIAFGEKMIISFVTKKQLTVSRLPPMDFYRFRHRSVQIKRPGGKTVVVRPLWIVGVSPFDTIIQEDEGHVVHLGSPKFSARWTMNDETIAKIENSDFYDEDFNIMIYETALMGDDENAEKMEEWLLEAACAVAYSKGLIAVAEPEEIH